jgi:hypothetical protein
MIAGEANAECLRAWVCAVGDLSDDGQTAPYWLSSGPNRSGGGGLLTSFRPTGRHDSEARVSLPQQEPWAHPPGPFDFAPDLAVFVEQMPQCQNGFGSPM